MRVRILWFSIPVIMAAILIAVFSTGQSVPQLVNYQGRLLNSSGQPLDGVTVNLTFTFYSQQSGGTVFLTVQQSNVSVSKGVYNVLIGSGIVTPGTETTLGNVFKNQALVWLGVKVNTDPEMIPRSQISSVGYAFRSNTADSVAPGAIVAANMGENCAVGQALIKTASGWGCGVSRYVNSWAWISGSNSTNQYSTYGIKGIPYKANIPGSRRGMVSCIDASGSLWLFGGQGYAASGGSGYLNDLWRWDGSNWTWISGNNVVNQNGNYGNKGTPDAANVPGSRHGAVSWIDTSGKLWLFGGNGYPASGGSGYLNDLWRWDGSNWTWISGSNATNQTGTYGTKGTPAPANVPGSRNYAVSWIDTSGNLWLFGGTGYAASGGAGILNDLWRWDGSNWAWISGGNATNQTGTYGTKGTPDPANVPGGHSVAVSWIDASGSLWLFGGLGYSASTFGDLNDLWRWDGINWTWISGSNAANKYGIYGSKGTPDPTNVPGSRESAASWIDALGNMWLFGGNGYAASSGGPLNDLWRWDGTNWTWISGSNAISQNGTYGTKGTPAPTNIPGGRGYAVSWIDASGNLWLFGGSGYAASGSNGYLNDLWKYYP